MERVIKIHVKQLPEGVYLATSKEVPGLVAQGRTINETLEIARDVARKILEAQVSKQKNIHLSPVKRSFDYPLVINW